MGKFKLEMVKKQSLLMIWLGVTRHDQHTAERTFHKCLKEIQTYQAAHPLDEPPTKNEAKSEMKNEPKLVRPSLTENKSNPEPYVQAAPKLGRNGYCHCPCNSGRKYKNCCLRNEPNSIKEALAA